MEQKFTWKRYMIVLHEKWFNLEQKPNSGNYKQALNV